MIDATVIQLTYAEKTGDLLYRHGGVSLDGHASEAASGTVVYTPVEPTSPVQWKAAEIRGNYVGDSVRVRFSNGIDQYYLDSSTMTFVEVDDTSNWDSQYTIAALLGNIDLWEHQSLTLIVHLVRTEYDRSPEVREAIVLMDIPSWEGPVADACREIAEFISEIEPVLMVKSTPASAQSQWKIGEPYTEHGYVITELVQALVDGQVVDGTLSNGVVTLESEAPAGSEVKLAVKFRPTTVVRHSDTAMRLDKIPTWWIQNLVDGDEFNGPSMPMSVAGIEVKERRVSLKIIVNGVGARQADSLAMRAALQRAFAGGKTIRFPSGRCVSAQLEGLVTIAAQGGTSLPMASGTISLVLTEYVGTTVFKAARDENNEPIFTSVTTRLPGATVVADGTTLD